MSIRSKLSLCSVAALAALSATACGSPKRLIQVQVNPSTATIYIDGESQGSGSKPVMFSFTEGNRRVVLQVVDRDKRPWYSEFTWPQVNALYNNQQPIVANLQER